MAATTDDPRCGVGVYELVRGDGRVDFRATLRPDRGEGGSDRHTHPREDTSAHSPVRRDKISPHAAHSHSYSHHTPKG